MTSLPAEPQKPKARWHAEVTGTFVQFLSRNPHKPNSRLAPRWKATYFSKEHAQEAKRVWELSGKPLWPADMRNQERESGKARNHEITPTMKRVPQQDELRL